MSKKMNEALEVLANHGRVLLEQADHDLANEHPSEIEPVEDVWSGGENFALELDHAAVTHGAEEQVTEPEVLDIVELKRMIEDILEEVALPTGEVAPARPGIPYDTGAGMPMETMIEELIDVGWLEGDVHMLEQLYDYIEDNKILDMNDISLGSAGPMPGEAYEMQYHGPITIEEYMGEAPRGGTLQGHPEDDLY